MDDFLASDLFEPTLCYDVLSTLLRSRDKGLFEYCMQQLPWFSGRRIIAFEDGEFCAIKAEDAIFALFGALNMRGERSIKLLLAFEEIQPAVSLGVLPYAFLPQFPLPLPSPVPEYHKKLPFTPRPRAYVAFQRQFRASAAPFAQFISNWKLWVLSGCVDGGSRVQGYLTSEQRLIDDLKLQCRTLQQLNSNALTLREKAEQYQQGFAPAGASAILGGAERQGNQPGSGQRRPEPSARNSRGNLRSFPPIPQDLREILNEMYRSDDIKLFDSFSGYLYASTFPQAKSPFQILGGGILSHVNISDCVAEALVSRRLCFEILRRLDNSSEYISIITKRLSFHFITAELFSSKLGVADFCAEIAAEGFKLREFTGTDVLLIYEALIKNGFTNYIKLIRQFQVFPNSTDIEIEQLSPDQRLRSGSSALRRICKMAKCSPMDLSRDFYKEAAIEGMDEGQFYLLLYAEMARRI